MNKYDKKIFIKFITTLLSSKDITKDILGFIIQNKNIVDNLFLEDLVDLRNKYITGLESVLLLILLAEISKITKNIHIKIFILSITQTDKENSLEKIEKFIKTDIPFFKDKDYLENFFTQSLPIFYQYIQQLFNIVFETRYKLAKFSESIALLDIDSDEFKSDLSNKQKHQLKDDMFGMSKDLYASIFPIYDYLVKTHINSQDSIHYQTIEDNNRLIEAVKFYSAYDKRQAVIFLEKLKSKIFIDNLLLKKNYKNKEYNKLKKLQDKVFYLQQQAYVTDDLFKHIHLLYYFKLQLHYAQIQFEQDHDDFSFEKCKGLL